MMKKTFLPTLLACLTLGYANLAHAHDDYNSDCYATECAYESNCGTFSIGGDWLYWKIEQQRMQAGSHVIGTTDGPALFINASALKPDFNYQSGYRIFADYTTPDTLWKLEASFTHAPTHASFSFATDPVNIATNFAVVANGNFPLFTVLGSNPLSALSLDWDTDVNYCDLDLSRRVLVCRNLEIKPHIGIRGLWIDQKVRIAGTGFNENQLPLSFTSFIKTKLKGIGIEGGLWGAWNITSGFSLIGHFGGSILYTQLKSNSHFEGTLETNTLPNINTPNREHLSLPMVDSLIGLTYTTRYCGKTIDLHVRWEHHAILSANQFNLEGSGIMTLQGLALGGSIGF